MQIFDVIQSDAALQNQVHICSKISNISLMVLLHFANEPDICQVYDTNGKSKNIKYKSEACHRLVTQALHMLGVYAIVCL